MPSASRNPPLVTFSASDTAAKIRTVATHKARVVRESAGGVSWFMRVVVAPDKFKGSLTAAQAYGAIANGVWAAAPHAKVSTFAMADGGEGTADVFRANGAKLVRREVCGPLPGSRVVGEVVIEKDGQTAFLDMATAAGLSLLDEADRDPTRTTTYGVGELIRFALDADCRRVVVGLGGSATCDGGLGAAQALGARVELDDGPATQPVTGGDLHRLCAVDSSLSRERSERNPPGADVQILCLHDVDNALLGDRGTARVFAPQKGATPEQVEQLEHGLARFVELLNAAALATQPGSGAAGGLGFGLDLACNATLRPGAAFVADELKLDDSLTEADLCLTGEGRFDATSLGGKAPIVVARRCQKRGVPCVVLAGSVEPDLDAARAAGVTSYRSIVPGPCSPADARAHAFDWLGRAAEDVVRLFLARPELDTDFTDSED